MVKIDGGQVHRLYNSRISRSKFEKQSNSSLKNTTSGLMCQKVSFLDKGKLNEIL